MTERYQFHFRHILKDGTVLNLYQHLKKRGILPVIEQNQQPALTIVR